MAGEEIAKLTDEDKEWLQRPFTIEEVEDVIKLCNGDKAPGTDGFYLHFFQRCWSIVKEDVWRTVEFFYNEGCFVRSLNATFIALIPKKKGQKR